GRARSRRPMHWPPTTRPRPRSGGRSSAHRTSKRSETGLCKANNVEGERLMRILLWVGVLLLQVIGTASAQNYPSRPITMIVPFPAGGPTDTIGRIMAERMRSSLGQTVIIENVTGAAGSIGVGRVARAAPDGYTLSIGHWSTHVVNGAIYSLPYDVFND